MPSPKLTIISIFTLTYLGIILFRRHGIKFVWLGVGLLLLSGVFTFPEAWQAINFNVLGIFAGVGILSGLFTWSGLPANWAARIVDRSKSLAGAIIGVSVLSGVISIFIDNVATCLVVAPIGIEIARRLKTSPVPFVISIAIASNLQGCATLIGDSPSIMMASFAGMNFNDFFWLAGKPGIFFAVQLGAAASFLVLYQFVKGVSGKAEKITLPSVKSFIPLYIFILLIVSLVINSFYRSSNPNQAALISLSWAALGLVWFLFRGENVKAVIKQFDLETLFFLTGIFILISSLGHAGVIDDISNSFKRLSGDSPLLAFNLIVWFSVLISAFIDNIPYTLAMLPVASSVAANFGMPGYPFYFGLLIGACLGGNITPIGAACNIVGVGMLRKEGYHISFAEFARLGLPFTLTAVLVGSVFIAFVWRV